MIDEFFPFPVKVRFQTKPIPATADFAGIPLGQGECVAVRLYLNSLEMDTKTNTAVANNLKQIYFGDSEGQLHELLAGQYSHLIYCSDLEEIFIRCNGVANPNLQVWIYTRV